MGSIKSNMTVLLLITICCVKNKNCGDVGIKGHTFFTLVTPLHVIHLE